MALNRFDLKADGIADVYRAALYLARGDNNIGLRFLKQARGKIGERFLGSSLSEISADKLTTRQQQLFLAEKLLDQYLRLKNL